MILTQDWSEIDYAQAWQQQEDLFAHCMEQKKAGVPCEDTVVFCSHPHVYTLGKHGKSTNMLLNETQLQEMGASLFYTDRGGDITYHGPGQIVCYPIIDLLHFNLGLKDYIHLLEEAVIRVCAKFDVVATRLKGATGVWLDIDTPKERKICAIGVKCSHFVTMHGLAFNVATDLRYFSYIHPCGFLDKGVTSLEKEVGRTLDTKAVQLQLQDELVQLLLKKSKSAV
ncbi:MAG: lipoyl(octanoyl) transferase LipB [Bacteroidaceae bacterium]|nr:lipoyl(octanoyl) transferase LipB [Bacteroidaceae bacterium]